MKTVQLKLYTFKELGRKAKAKALTDFRCVNIDFGWWDDEYDDFIHLCDEMGITVKKHTIKFEGFYSQGDGSAFSASVDFAKLTEAIRLQAWKRLAPLQDFRFPDLTIDRRVFKLITSGTLSGDPQIIARYKAYDIVADLGIFVECPKRSYDNLFEELEKLEEWLKQIGAILNSYLYQSLQKQYEFLIADTAIKESLLFNEYLFTADGRGANHLHDLAKHHNKTA